MKIGATIRGEIHLSDDDRRRHIYITGQTGTGKSTLLANMMRDDLSHNRPFALLDPNNDLAVYIADSVPVSRTRDVLYFDPLDPTHAVGFNPLQHVPVRLRSRVTANLVSAMRHVWLEHWGPRMSYILGHAIRLLLDNDATLLSLPVLLTDSAYRAQLLRRSTDPFNRFFWEQEYAAYNQRFRNEAIAPIQNKVGLFAADDTLRCIFGQPSAINVPYLMSQRKYLIANLNKEMGDEPAHLLGAFLTTTLAQVAQQRGTIPQGERMDFTLYVDEFQNFTTESFKTILSEARKYRLNLVLANQYLSQLPDDLRAAVLGNVTTIVCFRVGADDADILGKQLGMPPQSLIGTPNFKAWVKQGTGTTSLMETEREPEPLGRFTAVQNHTRANSSVPIEKVETQIKRFIEGV